MPKVIHHALTAVAAKSLVEKGALEPPAARAVRAGTFVLGLPSAASAMGNAGRNFTARFGEAARAAGAGGPIRWKSGLTWGRKARLAGCARALRPSSP